MPHAVLNEDWSEYHHAANGFEATDSACGDDWKTGFILGKLKKHYPYKSEFAIGSAIESCCISVANKTSLEDIIECVTARLSF